MTYFIEKLIGIALNYPTYDEELYACSNFGDMTALLMA